MFFAKLQAIEEMSVEDRQKHAASMSLVELGTLIAPVCQTASRLIEAYRPYIERWVDLTSSQGKKVAYESANGKLFCDEHGNVCDRDALTRKFLGVGIRRIQQLLAEDHAETESEPRPKTVNELADQLLRAIESNNRIETLATVSKARKQLNPSIRQKLIRVG